MQTLTVFFDGECPLCRQEIATLKKRDKHHRLDLEDIHAADFESRFPHINRQQANDRLHGQLADGEMLYGLDVTVAAWQRVGAHQWLKILRWPVIRWFADIAYLGFARIRQPLGRACSKSGVCKR